ncbi:MAG: hypothetical protein ACOX3V_04090 [Bacillota bacterium]
MRFRIDGVLESAGDSPRMHHEAIITRLKVSGRDGRCREEAPA